MCDTMQPIVTTIYQDILYLTMIKDFHSSKRTQLLIILLFRFLITLSVVEAVVHFVDFDFLNPNCELLRILFIKRCYHLLSNNFFQCLGQSGN
jgi:hypothetical protein